MRCPTCHDRLVKAQEGATEVFFRRLVLKAGGGIEIVCPRCRTHVALEPPLLDPIRRVLVPIRPAVTKGGP